MIAVSFSAVSSALLSSTTRTTNAGQSDTYSRRHYSRRHALRAAAGAGSVIFGSSAAAQAADGGFILAPPERGGLQAKWLEKVRVLLQDEADAIQYGGELAPGGPPSPIPALLLIVPPARPNPGPNSRSRTAMLTPPHRPRAQPIVQMQATLKKIAPMLDDPIQWPSVLAVIESGPFETLAFKKIFNGYADNIYYVSDSPEANAYLLGGATPSSNQTNQYLLRNEGLKQIAEVSALADDPASVAQRLAGERKASHARSLG